MSLRIAAVAVVMAVGCSRPAPPAPSPRDSHAGADAGREQGHVGIMQVEVEGTRDQLRLLYGERGVPGVELMRGLDDLGNGRWKGNALVDGDDALAALRARGVDVRITIDADTYRQEMDRARAIMQEAYGDAGPDAVS